MAEQNYRHLDGLPLNSNRDEEIEQDDVNSRDPYELLGFGYIAHFRTQRFLAVSFLLMAIIMGLAGVLNLKASP